MIGQAAMETSKQRLHTTTPLLSDSEMMAILVALSLHRDQSRLCITQLTLSDRNGPFETSHVANLQS